MAEETIDIVVRETGSAQAAANVEKIAEAAEKSAQSTDKFTAAQKRAADQLRDSNGRFLTLAESAKRLQTEIASTPDYSGRLRNDRGQFLAAGAVQNKMDAQVKALQDAEAAYRKLNNLPSDGFRQLEGITGGTSGGLFGGGKSAKQAYEELAAARAAGASTIGASTPASAGISNTAAVELSKFSVEAERAATAADKLAGGGSGGGGGGGGRGGGLNGAGDAGKKAADGIGRANVASGQLARTLASLAGGAVGTVTALIGVNLVKAFSTLNDQVDISTRNLRQFGQFGLNGDNVFAQIGKTVKETDTDLVGLNENVLRASQLSGQSAEGVARQLDLVARAVSVSGAPSAIAAKIQDAITEDSISGIISPRTIDLLQRNAQYALDVVSKGLGKSVKDIAALARDGRLSFNAFAQAMLSGSTRIESDFKNVPKTVAQASDTIQKSLEDLAKAVVRNLNDREPFQRFAQGFKDTVDGILADRKRLDAVSSTTGGGALAGAFLGGTAGFLSPVPGGLLLGAGGGAIAGAVGGAAIGATNPNPDQQFARGLDGIPELTDKLKSAAGSVTDFFAAANNRLGALPVASNAPVPVNIVALSQGAAAAFESANSNVKPGDVGQAPGQPLRLSAQLSEVLAESLEEANIGFDLSNGLTRGGGINKVASGRTLPDPGKTADGQDITVRRGIEAVGDKLSNAYKQSAADIVAPIKLSNVNEAIINREQAEANAIARQGYSDLGGAIDGLGSSLRSTFDNLKSSFDSFGQGDKGTLVGTTITGLNEAFGFKNAPLGANPEQQAFYDQYNATNPLRIAQLASQEIAQDRVSTAVRNAVDAYKNGGKVIEKAAANLNVASTNLAEASAPSRLISAYGAGDYYANSVAPSSTRNVVQLSDYQTAGTVISPGGVVVNFTVNNQNAVGSDGQSLSTTQQLAQLAALLQQAVRRA